MAILKKSFHILGQIIRMSISFTLLSIIYILGIGVTAIIARLAGKQFLKTKPEKGLETYWQDLSEGEKPTLEEYYRQF